MLRCALRSARAAAAPARRCASGDHAGLSKALSRPGAKPTAWRSLAEKLVDEGCESMYLDRLRGSYDVKAHVESIEEEMAEEMARALGRTTSRCDYEFALLDRARRMHDDDPSDDARAAFDAQRAACLKARQDLLIHRQALGFKTNNHAVVEKYYPIESLRKIDESPDEAAADAEQRAPWARPGTYRQGRNWGGFRTF